MVCCSIASLAVCYIYILVVLIYIHSRLKTVPTPSRLCLMLKTLLQRTQIFLEATFNLLPSLPKQPSILSQSLEASIPIQSSESSYIASAFSLFKDYFDKKLGAFKRDIQDELCCNTDSVAKTLKEDHEHQDHV